MSLLLILLLVFLFCGGGFFGYQQYGGGNPGSLLWICLFIFALFLIFGGLHYRF